MFKLYKTDLKRIFKDKLFLVACIIAAVFALLTPLLNKGLGMLLSVADESLAGMLGLDAKTMFFSSFAPGNNLGLIAPVLLGIIICKDFSFGTVRNKIINGKSRTSIFLSFFLSFTTVLLILMFIHGFLTLGVSLIFFEYQPTPFELKDLGFFLASLCLELLVYLFISAISSSLCVFMKNAGLAVVCYVAVNFVFTIFGSIIAIAVSFIDPAKEFLFNILQFLDRANIFMGSYIGMVPSYEWQGLLAVILGTLCGTALFLALGIASFNKKDLK